MPTTLSVDRHLDTIRIAAASLAEHAADLTRPVPTCPTWDAAALAAHQAMVHRWAEHQLRGEPWERTQTAIRAEEPDLLGYFAEGVQLLLDTLGTVGDDAGRHGVFLKDAPAPRAFWARRQAHETTVHSVDALAAALGRTPRADEVAIPDDLALDGIDELLCGFVPRGRGRLRPDAPYSLAVVPDDSARSWVLEVSAEGTTTRPDAAGGVAADATFRGPPVALYLGLWNRGTEIEASGRPEALEEWRRQQRVRWS